MWKLFIYLPMDVDVDVDVVWIPGTGDWVLGSAGGYGYRYHHVR